MKVKIGKYKKNGKRKVDVRIDPSDTFNMDETLAYIILPMLKQIKEGKVSASHIDFEDAPADLHPGPEWICDNYSGVDGTDEHFFERWNWALDEMIYAFDSIITGWPFSPAIENYLDGTPSDGERVKNGLRLFGKYYTRLWTI